VAVELDRLWTYQTRPGVLNFLLGWIKALRWQRLPEMECLGDILLTNIDGIAAYCDHRAPLRRGRVCQRDHQRRDSSRPRDARRANFLGSFGSRVALSKSITASSALLLLIHSMSARRLASGNL